MLRHRKVNVLGKLDESSRVVQSPQLPCEILRIHRYAVAAESGPGIERHESERLGTRSFYHFPHVQTQSVADEGHLVGQRDVGCPECVLQQLGHLRRLRGGDAVDSIDDGAVKLRCDFGTGRSHSPNEFRRVAYGPCGLAGVNAFGRERQKEVVPRLKPDSGVVHQQRKQEFLSGAGVHRALKNDECVFMKVRRDALGRVRHLGHIRRPRLAERRRHAHDHRIGLCHAVET